MNLTIFKTAVLLIAALIQYSNSAEEPLDFAIESSPTSYADSQSTLQDKFDQGQADQNHLSSGRAIITINRQINKTEVKKPPQVKFIWSPIKNFPSLAQIAGFIQRGDTVALLKTVETVSSDDIVSCSRKASYLDEVIGIVKKALLRKNLESSHLLKIIQGSKKQIKRFEQQISRINKQRAQLNILQMQKTLYKAVREYRYIFEMYNSVKGNISAQEVKVIGLSKEIQILERQNNEYRTKFSNDRNLIYSNQQIKENDDKIAEIKQTIRQINSKITRLISYAQQIKRNYNLLEVNVEKARAILLVSQEKDQGLIELIRQFQTRISNQKINLVEDQRSQVQALIDNLQFVVSTIQAQINRQYYFCYGEGKVETITSEKSNFYLMKKEVFPKYAANVYGIQMDQAIINNNDIKFQVILTYTRPWMNYFGYPKNPNINLDFSCEGGKGTSLSGRGVIESIDSDSITVKDFKGEIIDLAFGGCSRIQSTTNFPIKGQKILWRGVISQTGKYRLFSASCF